MFIKKNLKKIKFAVETLIIYLNDYKKYLKATGCGDLNSNEGLIYRLRKDYHKIEKGLTMAPRRNFFGLKVLDNILLYIEQINNKSNSEVIKAVKVIEKYLEEHSYDVSLNKYIRFVGQFQVDSKNEDVGFYSKSNKEYKFTQSERETFEKIVSKRRTTRHFKRNVIEKEVFDKVFDIAKFTPSACNRQSWDVKVVKSEKVINKILLLQNGNDGFKEEIKNIIVITADLSSCVSPQERKQVWFDSGLFTMNLINTLHTNQIGSCCLNWCVDVNREREISQLLDLTSSKVVTVILAVGYYKNDFSVCDSPKKNSYEFVEYL